MSKSNETDSSNLIESAMDRLARKAPDGLPDRGPREPPWRQDFDRAEAGRLAQWPTASGYENPLASALLHKLASALAAGHSHPVVHASLLIALLAFALGATGLIWQTINDANQGGVAARIPSAAIASGQITAAEPPPVPVAAPEAPEPAPVEIAIASPAALPVDAGEAQARDLIEQWRQDWASRNIEGYLSWYSPEFLPANGQTHTAWAAARRKKLSSQSDISVQVDELRFEHIDSDHLKAVFLQGYASGTYRESAQPKTLLLARTGGDWRIAGEWQGTPPASRVRAK